MWQTEKYRCAHARVEKFHWSTPRFLTWRINWTLPRQSLMANQWLLIRQAEVIFNNCRIAQAFATLRGSCWNRFRPRTTRLICCTAMATTCEKFRWKNGKICSSKFSAPTRTSVTQNMKSRKAKNYTKPPDNNRWKGLLGKKETAR